MRIAFIAVLFTLVGCTDTSLSALEALGSPGTITCWSGTQKIYEGVSTGKIQTVAQSDGWEFREADTNRFVRVTGACVIRN